MDFTDIIKQLGIDNLPEAEQKQTLQTMLETLNMRVSLRLGRELSEEQLKGLEEAAKKGDDAAQAEMDRIYPGYDKMYQEEIDKLKADIQ